MARDYSLGTAHGVVKIDYDGKGVLQAKQAMGDTKVAAAELDASMTKVGTGAVVAGGLLAAGFALAVNSAAAFEQQMSNVKAVTGANEAQMARLEAQALSLGKSTVFSATEIGAAQEELLKAGLGIEDVLNGAAAATVALAAAGGVAIEEAAKIAANAKNAFEIAATDLPHVADILAGAANASAISVSELGQSLQQSSAVAHLAGLSFEDTATAIAAMGNAGIKGSDAGTSLKTMLQNLQPATAKQRAEFERLNLVTADGSSKFFDAQGNVKSLAEISGVLETALAGMTNAQKLASLEILFGTDAIRAAAVVAGTGADGINELAGAMSEISAADVAATRLDNFRGNLEQLRGALETFMITIGTPLLNALSGVASGLADLINYVTDLPGPVRQLVTVFGLGAAAVLLLAGATLVLIPRINATSLALTTMAANGSRAAIALRGVGSFLTGPWGIALAAAVIGLGSFASGQQKLKDKVEEVRTTLDQQTGAITENTRTWAANELQTSGALDAAEVLGLSLKTITDAALGQPAAIKAVNDAISGLADEYEVTASRGHSAADAQDEQVEAAHTLADALPGVTAEVGAAQEKQKQFAEAIGDTDDKIGEALPGLDQYAVGADGVTGALGRAEGAADAVNEAISVFEESMRRLFDISWGVSEAEDALSTKIHSLEDAVNDAHDAVVDGVDGAAEYNRTLDGTSQAAIANRNALRDMVKGLGEVAQQGIDAGDSEAVVTQRYQEGRQALEDKLVALGFNKEAVQALIDTEGDIQPLIDTYFATTGLADATERVGIHDDAIRGVPPDWNTVFDADTADAEAKIATFKRLADEATADRTATITVRVAGDTGIGGILEGLDGGRVAAPGGAGGAGGAGDGARSAGSALSGLSAGAWAAGVSGGDGARLTLPFTIPSGLTTPAQQQPAQTADQRRRELESLRPIEYHHHEHMPFRRESSRDRARSSVLIAQLGGAFAGHPGGGQPIVESR